MLFPSSDPMMQQILCYLDTTQEQFRPSHAWQIGHFIQQLNPDELQSLSDLLAPKIGPRFKLSNLKAMQKLACLYPQIDQISDRLTWTHYRLLLPLQSTTARAYYFKAALQYQWSTRQLRRQISNQYYERRQAAGIGPILDHYVLEFTQRHKAPRPLQSEQDLEAALIHQLQDFLIELGDDLAFIAKQKQIRIESGKHYFIDLVFYHLRHKCFLIIELKVTPFHQNMIGQLDFYVNYYDQHYKQTTDAPTIGLLLCPSKDTQLLPYTYIHAHPHLHVATYELKQTTASK